MIEDDAIDMESPSESEAVAQAPVEEKMLPASRVQELIKKAKLKGRDDMTQQLEELRAENERLRQAQPPMGGMNNGGGDADSIRKQVYEDLQAQLQSEQESRAQEQLKMEAQKLAQEYHSKIDAGKWSHGRVRSRSFSATCLSC